MRGRSRSRPGPRRPGERSSSWEARSAPPAPPCSRDGALRVGAGRLTLAVGASAAAHVATALPECGVVPLPVTSTGSVRGAGIRAASRDLAGADAVLIGPGLDDAAETARLLHRAAGAIGRDTVLVLDAFALGALAGHPRLPVTARAS